MTPATTNHPVVVGGYGYGVIGVVGGVVGLRRRLVVMGGLMVAGVINGAGGWIGGSGGDCEGHDNGRDDNGGWCWGIHIMGGLVIVKVVNSGDDVAVISGASGWVGLVVVAVIGGGGDSDWWRW
nr:hypothetical protein [Tanacetum cinerariifolium]